ncbi:NADH-quinone oxidoreductase subunit J [bacterium]|nr:MAG: NADH-quinone oxidoreductase subunit J [bacterium]RKZ16095.1 MAG: NADH-quinone oxidoreductase subunit J [bacterium]
MIGGWIWILFAAIGVFGAASVALSKNVVRCGFGLLAALISIAAMYAFLGADFLVATQVIVYVGGILVLILFGVMMTHRITPISLRDDMIQPMAAGLAALLIFGLSMLMIITTDFGPMADPGPMLPTTHDIGRAFLTSWLFPFEFASVLLLVAMIGAAMLTREPRPDDMPDGMPNDAPNDKPYDVPNDKKVEG